VASGVACGSTSIASTLGRAGDDEISRRCAMLNVL
jgi:hypothetical protein